MSQVELAARAGKAYRISGDPFPTTAAHLGGTTTRTAMKFRQIPHNRNVATPDPESPGARSNSPILEAASDALDDGIIVWDAKGRIHLINPVAEKIHGVSRRDILGKSISQLAHDSQFPMEGIQEAFANQTSLSYIEESHKGSDYIVDIKSVVDSGAAGSFFVVSFKNISKIRRSLFGKESGGTFTSSSSLYHDDKRGFRTFVVDSQLKELLTLGLRACEYGSRLLISGESGVGKSLFARQLHQRIKRRSKGFVHVNCGSIPETLFESALFGYERGSFTGALSQGKKGLIETAQGGTLFLDEVGEIGLECQSKLLQFLDDGSYTRVGGVKPQVSDTQIISASNQDLEKMVKERTFRPDLYYRLRATDLRIPPLRERRYLIGSILELYMDYVADRYNRKLRITERCEAFLNSYSYPGNIRELENILQHMAVSSSEDTMDLQHLPESIRQHALDSGAHRCARSTSRVDSALVSTALEDEVVEIDEDEVPLRKLVQEFETNVISKAIRRHGSKRKAAAALGVNIATIVRKSR